MNRFLKLFAMMAAVCLLASCHNSGQPAGEFSTFIKAYTGGVVSGTSTIRIEFNGNVGAAAEPQNLISFSPSIKGEARWAGNTILEFIPEEGELKPGKEYDASVRLDKLFDIRDSKLKKFNFSFKVAPKEIALEIDGMTISTSDPSVASLSGKVLFSSDMPQDKVAEIFTLAQNGESKGSRIAASDIAISQGASANEYKFVISGIKRNAGDNLVKLTADASSYGYKHSQTESYSVPGTEGFRLVSANRVDSADPYVDVTFSQPLDNTQSPEGLFTLINTGRHYFQKDGNRMRIYYESIGSESVELRVSAATRDIDGNRLGEDFSYSFTNDELKPRVSLLLDGNILPDPSQLILPFTAQNLSAVDIRIIKIYESNILTYLQENDINDGYSIRRSGRLVYRTTLRLDSDSSIDLKSRNLFAVDLSNVIKKEPGALYRVRLSFNRDYSLYGKGRGGFTVSDGQMIQLQADGLTPEEEDVWDTPQSYYYESDYDWSEYNWEDRDNPATPTYYMDSDLYPYINLFSSDLGLVFKTAGNGKVWVAANDILSTKPLKGTEITVYNYQLQSIGSAKTDSDGLAEIDVKGKPFIISARHGSSTAYLKVTDGNEKSLSRFDTGGQTVTKGLKGYVYGERGVWRPGDTMHLTLVIENHSNSIPEGHPVTMEVYSPLGQFYDKQISTDGVNGFYSFELKTKADDPTGTWNAYFKIGGATFHKALHVETIKPNRLKINLDIKEKALEAGQAANMTITSNWLTGPAASGMRAVVGITLANGSSSIKGHEGYIFHDPVTSYYPEEFAAIDGQLNSEGKLSAKVSMPHVANAPGLLNASIVTQVFEPGGDASIISKTIPYSPYKAYVGIKAPKADGDKWLETDTDHRFDIVVSDVNGNLVKGHRLEYKIYKIAWSWWWESRSESLDSYINSRYVDLVTEGKLNAADGKASLNFSVEYPDWGRYLVYVKDLDGGHATGDMVTIDWPAWKGRSDKSDPTALTMLTFTTDKAEYKVGENATVYIPAAVNGRALVSIENGSGVISQKWVNTSDIETKYSFSVKPEMAPNFYVHITLLQPHKQTANDLPIRMYGVHPVMVSDEASHLRPEISMPDVVRPQESFTVKVKEAKGKQMTYTLAIVDEGLLDITSFKTPDPWSAMYSKEALGVRTWDLYDEVVGAYGGRFPSLLSVGGDEDFTKEKVRENRFNPVVKFYGPFTLKNGTASHKIELPMYVGSVRVMLVAGNGRAYGNAEKSVPVRSPLMVLPTLPRVMGSGENVTLPVNVFAMDDNIKDVKVSVKVSGPLSVNGAAEQNIRFSGSGDQLVRFNLQAAAGEGMAKVTVIAESAGQKAEETVNLEVRNPNPVITTVSRSVIEAGKSTAFDWNGAEARTSQLEIASFPTLDLNGAFTFVENYSYYCTEQLSARGMSLVYTSDLLNDENAAKAKAMIPEILQQLYSRQLADGGFAYWPSSSSADEWATSMAGQFLTEAKNKGYKVDAGVINAWKSFQKKCVTNYKKSESALLDDLQQAYRLYTLALAGAAEEGAMNRLKGAENLSAQAAWRLAAAYSLRGKDKIAKEMVQNLETNIRAYRDNSTFGSSLRDKAMILETMVLVDDIAGASTIAQDVADAISEEGYSSQTVAFASVAMGRLAKKMNKDALIAKVDGKDVKSAQAVYSQVLDPKAGKVSIENRNVGAVFASVVTSSQAGFGSATAPKSSGIGVKVSFQNAAGEKLPDTGNLVIRQGEEFFERIEVSNNTAEPVYNLALTQIIPSGWEIFNERLYGGSSKSDSEHSYKDIRDDRTSWFFDLPAGTGKVFWIRLQATYEGNFILPAAVCEAMYDNKISGNSASGNATVTR